MSDRELKWDDVIVNDGEDFKILPAGEYKFTVLSMERSRHPGSANLPACNKAIVKIKVDGEEHGTSSWNENLMLHSTLEWKLCAFFRAIGQRKSGEKLTMDWTKVVGSEGRAKIHVRKWKGKDNEEKESNQVEKWIDPPTETEPLTF